VHHPDTATACIDEEASRLLADGCLSGRELSQEIALLEAHLSENETEMMYLSMYALASKEEARTEETTHDPLGESLLLSFLIMPERWVDLWPGLGRLIIPRISFLLSVLLERATRLSSWQHVFAWSMFIRLRRAQARAARGTLIRLKFLSELTSLSAPLPAYGAELSQYRHRFR
jgi:hypothetical protein